MRDWVEAQYGKRLMRLWASENIVFKKVEILLEGSAAAQVVESQAAIFKTNPEIEPASRHDDISAPLDPRFTFDNFIVGKPNELAFAAARRVAEAEAVPFNPLFLYGGVGLGKTHLMHAIAWHIRRRTPERRVVYLSAEKFMYQFIRALRYKDTVSFKDQFRSVDVLMIDDVQFIAGKDNTQEEFFHTFNALVDQITRSLFPRTNRQTTSRAWKTG
jgi:chromosomal replication initiator protein